MTTHYVYIDWTLEVEPRAFYVGMGSRARVRITKRNMKHTNICKAHGVRRDVILETSDRNIASQLEIRLISELKTRGDCDGHWGANFTAGGDGVTGRKHRADTRTKISDTLMGRSKSEATRLNMRKAQSKKNVSQYDLQGMLMATYSSKAEAQRMTGVPSSNIRKCCRRNLKSAGGFVWRNESDHFDPKMPYTCTSIHREHARQAALRRGR